MNHGVVDEIDFWGLYKDPDEYDRVHANFTEDVAFYVKRARAAAGPVLELCCGTGRITIPIAQAGVEVVGVDNSALMLRKARQKSKSAGVKIRWVRSDFQNFELDRKFALIFIAYHSLHHVWELEAFARVFERIRAHLAPKGQLILEFWNLANMNQNKPPARIWSFDEYEKLIKISGFDIIERMGDVDERPFGPKENRIIFTCQQR